MKFFCSSLLESGVVGPNTMVDKYSPCSALVRVCENGFYQFAKTLIEHGAQVTIFLASYVFGNVASDPNLQTMKVVTSLSPYCR